jgi:hypothetical protein
MIRVGDVALPQAFVSVALAAAGMAFADLRSPADSRIAFAGARLLMIPAENAAGSRGAFSEDGPPRD